MIKFLVALGNRPIARLMAAGGFDNDDYQLGYGLFRQAMGPELIETGPMSLYDPAAHELLDNIDQWENIYFDIADATLRHEYPVLHERLFRNINKTTGPEVIYTVGTFLDRLNELEQEGGAEIEAALALLAKRRLTKKKRAAAEGLIKDATKLNVGDLPVEADIDPDELDGEPSEAEKARLVAEEKMWAWFKDWAQIARTIVKDKRYRYYMGISQRVDRPSDDEPEVDDGPGVTVVAPAPAPVPVPVAPGANGPSAGTPVRA
jgi:hypothetical protein